MSSKPLFNPGFEENIAQNAFAISGKTKSGVEIALVTPEGAISKVKLLIQFEQLLENLDNVTWCSHCNQPIKQE